MTIKIARPERGFPYALPGRPAEPIPKMPWDIGDVSDDELMALLSQFTVWANHLVVKVADAVMEEEAIEDEVEMAKAGFIVEDSKVTVARAKAMLDDEARKLREKLRVAHRYRKLIEGLYENCNRSANACSRELTRRTATHPAQRRESWTSP